MKAVLITKENRPELLRRYCFEPEEAADIFPLNFYMIAEWGDNGQHRFEGVVPYEYLNANYDRVGEPAKNGFFEIKPRP